MLDIPIQVFLIDDTIATVSYTHLDVYKRQGSNRGPSACKADALNQLSYTPNLFYIKI